MTNIESHNHSNMKSDDETKEYFKFYGVIFGIVAVAYYYFVAFGDGQLSDFMRFFMGMFLLVFSVFKFWNLEDFPELFAKYDVIARKYIVYGYIFPFIQIFLAALYLASFGGVYRDLFTMVFTGISAWGVINETILKKSYFQCACLGGVIKLPLSKVAIVEDVGMFFMAALMLVL